MAHLTFTYAHLKGKSSPSDNEVTEAIECNVDYINQECKGLKFRAYVGLNTGIYLLLE